MKAIHVKKLPPSERKGTRFKAMGLDLCVITGQDHALTDEGNAAYAAQELLDRYNSANRRHFKLLGTGTLPDSTIAVLLAVK
jgi:hypothetical protein